MVASSVAAVLNVILNWIFIAFGNPIARFWEKEHTFEGIDGVKKEKMKQLKDIDI